MKALCTAVLAAQCALAIPATASEIRPGQIAQEISALKGEVDALLRQRDHFHKAYIRSLYTVEVNTSRCEGRSKELAIIDARIALREYLENPVALMSEDVKEMADGLANGSLIIDGVGFVCRENGYPPFVRETLPVAAAAAQEYDELATDMINHIDGLRDRMLEAAKPASNP